MDLSIVQIAVILTILPLIHSQTASESQNLLQTLQQLLGGYSGRPAVPQAPGLPGIGQPPSFPIAINGNDNGNGNGNGENGENGDRRRRTCLPGGSIVCGPNTDCVGRRNNVCQCKPGYSGDPYSVEGCSCTLQCGVNAHCEGRSCVCDPNHFGDPYTECFPGNCGGRICGANAQCINDVCVCNSGTSGDPYVGCTATCGDVTCGHNAYCDAGTCVCNPGYYPLGDDPATWGCAGPCRDRFCGFNATCENDFCTCIHLHGGNAFYPFGCSISEARQCGDRICGWNAVCVDQANGICECVDDYHNYVPDPTPYVRCRATNNCGRAPCGPNEYCVENYSFCACVSGYSRVDGVCQPGCNLQECGPKQFCYNQATGPGECRCITNYVWDATQEKCVYSPDNCGDNPPCGPLAVCRYRSPNYVCECPTGYVGDPTIGCSLPVKK